MSSIGYTEYTTELLLRQQGKFILVGSESEKIDITKNELLEFCALVAPTAFSQGYATSGPGQPGSLTPRSGEPNNCCKLCIMVRTLCTDRGWNVHELDGTEITIL